MHQVGQTPEKALTDFKHLPHISGNVPPALKADPSLILIELSCSFRLDLTTDHVQNVLKVAQTTDHLPKPEIGIGFVHRSTHVGPKLLAF